VTLLQTQQSIIGKVDRFLRAESAGRDQPFDQSAYEQESRQTEAVANLRGHLSLTPIARHRQPPAPVLQGHASISEARNTSTAGR
jgi:hypothetical protein